MSIRVFWYRSSFLFPAGTVFAFLTKYSRASIRVFWYRYRNQSPLVIRTRRRISVSRPSSSRPFTEEKPFLLRCESREFKDERDQLHNDKLNLVPYSHKKNYPSPPALELISNKQKTREDLVSRPLPFTHEAFLKMNNCCCSCPLLHPRTQTKWKGKRKKRATKKPLDLVAPDFQIMDSDMESICAPITQMYMLARFGHRPKDNSELSQYFAR